MYSLATHSPFTRPQGSEGFECGVHASKVKQLYIVVMATSDEACSRRVQRQR